MQSRRVGPTAIVIVGYILGSPAPGAGTAPPQLKRAELPLHAGSEPRISGELPVVVDDRAVYAVAADGRTILWRPADFSAAWRAVPAKATLERVGGLAVGNGRLFVTDAAARRILAVAPQSGEVSVLHEGPPLESPGDVALASDLYVSDGGRVFRLSAGGGLTRVSLEEAGTRPPAGPIFLASTGSTILISSPEIGGVSEIHSGPGAGTERSSRQSWMMKGSSSQARAFETPDTLQRRAFPEIEKPGRVSYYRGIVYVVDQAGSGSAGNHPPELYAFGRHDQRPVRLVSGTRGGIGATTSLAVNGKWIYVLRDSQVERWPRVVPAEVNLPQVNLSAIMTPIYEYLLENGILPVRQVRVEQNIERTLRMNRVLIGAYVTDFTPVLCRLNRGLCIRGELRAVQQGELLWIPDVNSENYMDAAPMVLRGKDTLGDVVDRMVHSPQFEHFRSEEKLRELNEKEAYREAEPLRRRTRGEYIVPVEYIRYVAPILASDAPPASGTLTALTNRFTSLRIRSQEERRAVAYAAGQPQPGGDADWKLLKAQFDQVLRTIDYDGTVDPLAVARVGIAEEFVDTEHPDFVVDGVSAWIPEIESLLPEPASGTPAPVEYRVRKFERTDHGTMVGGLIGLRHTPFETRGLAPHAKLFHLHSSDPQIGEDIRRAFLRGVRIYNISAHYGSNRIPASLEERIRIHPTALFVVAAGNDVVPGRDLEVCNGFMAFPVCWADKKNVLVVTATNATGDMILAPLDQDPVVPGANWSPRWVHVAAPGDGFHAPGVSRSYVPARGSSFATPLVTAAAALLYSQRIFDPWLIKQRILSTADPIGGLAGKVFAGRVNVRRAVSDVSVGVLTRKPRGAAPGETLKVDVDDSSRITVRTADGRDQIIPLADLRRIHRLGGHYRVVYLERDTLRVLEQVAFPTATASQFIASPTAGGGPTIMDLIDWDDFVGPIPVM